MGGTITSLVCLSMSGLGYFLFPRWSRKGYRYTRWFCEYSYMWAVAASFFSMVTTYAYLSRIIFLLSLSRAMYALRYRSTNQAKENAKQDDSEEIETNNKKKMPEQVYQEYWAIFWFLLSLVHVLLEELICLGTNNSSFCGLSITDGNEGRLVGLGVGLLIWSSAAGVYLTVRLSVVPFAKNAEAFKASTSRRLIIWNRILYSLHLATFFAGCWLLSVS